jgi:3'-phosphoadenosine 5'-phosphosulfate sulfotransferase (PAPS reductase)/FAD synthetase
VFADTGWEHPATYEYIRGPLAEKLGAIDEVRGDLLMASLVRKKGMFPSRMRRFCTEDLKVLAAYHAALDVETVNAVGIRAGESEARSKLGEWEFSEVFDGDTWRPLIAWTEADVIAMHARHGLTPNPLYLRGATRVGCFPCIFSRKAEIALVAREWPERIEEIRALESEVSAKAVERGAKHPERTFFRGHTANIPVPIDEAVLWASTAHGGRQMLLLDTEPPGCVRWGLCEAPDDPK